MTFKPSMPSGPRIVTNPQGNSMPGHPPTVVAPPSHVVQAHVAGQGTKTSPIKNAGNVATTKVGGGVRA